MKRQVIIYEITRLKSRHKRLREVLLPAQAQCLNVFSEGRLCVGYQSGFTIYSLMGDQHPLCESFSKGVAINTDAMRTRLYKRIE